MNHRTATRSAARLASAGGALFALGNLLHPLEPTHLRPRGPR